MIPVSFSFFIYFSFLFYVIFNFYKNYFIIIFIHFLHENYFYFFMFWDFPGCSGMFRVPGFICALVLLREFQITGAWRNKPCLMSVRLLLSIYTPMWQEVFLYLRLRYNIRTVGSCWTSLVVKLKMSGRPRNVSSRLGSGSS